MIEPEALLAPIPGDMPQGIDLRNPTRKPALYDALAALRAARQREDNADLTTPPDWGAVENLCAIILIEHSKDMEAAAGLAEASVRNDSFAGLAAAGSVIAGLADHFWANLFPVPEEDEPDVSPEEARLKPLNHLIDQRGRLLPGIRSVILFTLDDGTSFSLLDCAASKTWTALRPEERSKRLSSLPADERAAREKSPAGRMWNEVKQALSQMHGNSLVETRDDVAAALAAWRNVSTTIQGLAGDGLFSCEAVIDLLGDVLRTMNEVAPIASTTADPVSEQQPGDDTMMQVPAGPSSAGPSGSALAGAAQVLASREDALRRLDEITAFFRRTEPYSPVAYTLEEAMRRARLPWPEWLTEAVPDKQQRDAILNRLGLRPDAD